MRKAQVSSHGGEGMFIAMSRYGISVSYKCYCLKYTVGLFRKKCPDEYTNKCMKCKYCKAELSGEDATRLLNSFGSRMMAARGTDATQ